MKIEKGKRVSIRVMLKVKDGDVIEKNVVQYFQGAGTMLPGLEAAVEGLEKGAVKKGTLPASKAFGDPSKQIAKTLSKKEFPADAELEAGSQFMAKGADGKTDVVLLIKKVDGDTVECELRHPLADKDIDFEVEVMSVTDPTPPPLPASAVASDDD